MLPRRIFSLTSPSSIALKKTIPSRHSLVMANSGDLSSTFSLFSSTRIFRARHVETIRPDEIIIEFSSSSSNKSNSTSSETTSNQYHQRGHVSSFTASTTTSKIFTYSAATASFVESYDYEESPSSSSSSASSTMNQHSSSSSSSSSHHHNHSHGNTANENKHNHNHHHHHHEYEEVTSIDTFSKGKIFNYLKKMNPHVSKLKNSSDLFKITEEREIQEDGSEIILVKCRLQLTLPHPHRSATAQGTAQTDRDAEYLCTMHAQRILDALGVPLFSLPSMQKRHAEAARSHGRWSPMPGEKMKPQGTPLPPPLKMATISQAAVTNNLNNNNNNNNANNNNSSKTASSTTDNNTTSATNNNNTSNQQPFHSLRTGDEDLDLEDPEVKRLNEESAKLQKMKNKMDRQQQQDEQLKEKQQEETAKTDVKTPSSTTSTNGDASPHHNLSVPEGATHIQQLYYLSPWVYAAAHRPPPLAANIRDATEGGTFQLVNVLSTRCSGSKHGISLPCIFDKLSLTRIKDAFAEMFYSSSSSSSNTETGNKIVEKEMKLAHLQLPGSMQRMYVAEFNLTDFIQEGIIARQKNVSSSSFAERALFDHLKRFVASTSSSKVVARGKASETGEAMLLCGMHAELLMDHYSIPLYPSDARKQSEHALHALENGRWAPGFDVEKLSTEIKESLISSSSLSSSSSLLKYISGVRGPPTEEGLKFTTSSSSDSSSSSSPPQYVLEEDVPPPLPLKQLVGAIGDAEGLPALGRAQYRSVPERMVMLHNELCNSITEMQESNPDASMAREAMRAVRQFQLDRGSFYRSHYVITQMGEAYRASMVLPVIEKVGVQGGVGVGRNPQHAMELCALHAIDVLNWLEIPVYGNDIERQRELANKRKSLRLSYFYHPEDPEFKNHHDGAMEAQKESVTENKGETSSTIKKKEKPPPGLLLLEALGASRPLCPDFLVKKIQRLKVLEQFEVMKDIKDADLIEKGNREKQLVLLYLQRTKQPVVPYVIQLNMQKNSLHMHCVAALEFSVYITPENCPQPFNVHLNPSKLKVHPNADKDTNNNNNTDGKDQGSSSLVGLGASLKRKDADRCLFLHIASILRKFGIPLEKEEAYAAAERRRIKAGGAPAGNVVQQPLPTATSTSNATENSGQQPQQLTKKQLKRLRAEKEEQERREKERKELLAKETPAQRKIREEKEAEEEQRKEKRKQEAEEKERLKKQRELEEIAALRAKYENIELPPPIMHRLLDEMLKKDLHEKNYRAQKAKTMQAHRSNFF